jgi:hypothetical protein
MLAVGSGVGYKAFTLILSGCVTDKRSVKDRRYNSLKMTARCGATGQGAQHILEVRLGAVSWMTESESFC